MLHYSSVFQLRETLGLQFGNDEGQVQKGGGEAKGGRGAVVGWGWSVEQELKTTARGRDV